MSSRLRIGVVGAGQIGGFVGGRLLAADEAAEGGPGSPQLSAEKLWKRLAG